MCVNEVLRTIFGLCIMTRLMRKVVHVAHTGKERNACSIFVGKLKKRLFGGAVFGCEDI